MTPILFVVIPWFQMGVSVSVCPESSRLHRRPEDAKDYCYWLIHTSQTAMKGHALCQQQGGILATIPDQEAQNFISQMGLPTDEKFAAFIGVHDMIENGKYQTYDGHKQVYFNWEGPHLDNLSEYECVIITRKSKLKWNDIYCYFPQQAICSKAILKEVYIQSGKSYFPELLQEQIAEATPQSNSKGAWKVTGVRRTETQLPYSGKKTQLKNHMEEITNKVKALAPRDNVWAGSLLQPAVATTVVAITNTKHEEPLFTEKPKIMERTDIIYEVSLSHVDTKSSELLSLPTINTNVIIPTDRKNQALLPQNSGITIVISSESANNDIFLHDSIGTTKFIAYTDTGSEVSLLYYTQKTKVMQYADKKNKAFSTHGFESRMWSTTDVPFQSFRHTTEVAQQSDDSIRHSIQARISTSKKKSLETSFYPLETTIKSPVESTEYVPSAESVLAVKVSKTMSSGSSQTTNKVFSLNQISTMYDRSSAYSKEIAREISSTDQPKGEILFTQPSDKMDKVLITHITNINPSKTNSENHSEKGGRRLLTNPIQTIDNTLMLKSMTDTSDKSLKEPVITGSDMWLLEKTRKLNTILLLESKSMSNNHWISKSTETAYTRASSNQWNFKSLETSSGQRLVEPKETKSLNPSETMWYSMPTERRTDQMLLNAKETTYDTKYLKPSEIINDKSLIKITELSYNRLLAPKSKTNDPKATETNSKRYIQLKETVNANINLKSTKSSDKSLFAAKETEVRHLKTPAIRDSSIMLIKPAEARSNVLLESSSKTAFGQSYLQPSDLSPLADHRDSNNQVSLDYEGSAIYLSLTVSTNTAETTNHPITSKHISMESSPLSVESTKVPDDWQFSSSIKTQNQALLSKDTVQSMSDHSVIKKEYPHDQFISTSEGKLRDQSTDSHQHTLSAGVVSDSIFIRLLKKDETGRKGAPLKTIHVASAIQCAGACLLLDVCRSFYFSSIVNSVCILFDENTYEYSPHIPDMMYYVKTR